jgi:phage terminase large subunit
VANREVAISPVSKAFEPLWDAVCYRVDPDNYQHIDERLKKVRHIILASGRACAKTFEVTRIKDYAMGNCRVKIASARGNWVNLDLSTYSTFELITSDAFHGTHNDYNFIPSRNAVEHKYTGSEDLYIGLNHDPESTIKGIPDLRLMWSDEAQQLNKDAVGKSIPTVFRSNPNALCLWSLNPTSSTDAIYTKFPFDIEKAEKERLIWLDEDSALVMWFNQDDNPFFNDTIRSEMEMDYKKDPQYARHIWGGHLLGEEVGSLIPSSAIKECICKDVGDVRSWITIAGIDLGGTGDPTVVRLRQGRRFGKSKKWFEADHSKLAPMIAEFLRENNVDIVCGDGTGFGGSFFSFLRQLYGDKRVFSINFGASAPRPGYNKMRAYMADKMREFIVMGCYIPDEPALIEELLVVRGWKSKGVSYLDEKKNIKSYLGHSCDEFDAAMLTFAVGDSLKENRTGSSNMTKLILGGSKCAIR